MKNMHLKSKVKIFFIHPTSFHDYPFVDSSQLIDQALKGILYKRKTPHWVGAIKLLVVMYQTINH